MTNWAFTNKPRLATILLAIAGIVVAVVYALCPGTCSALRGTLLSFDLKWVIARIKRTAVLLCHDKR